MAGRPIRQTRRLQIVTKAVGETTGTILPGTHYFHDETENCTYWYTLNDFKADHNAYLYANHDQTDLHFTGPLYTQPSKEYHLYAADDDDDNVYSTNLLGNPYPCNARITIGEEVQEVFYSMNTDT